MFCTNCGGQNEPGTAFCVKCGSRLGSAAATPPAGSSPVSDAVPPAMEGSPGYTTGGPNSGTPDTGMPPVGGYAPPPGGYIPPAGGYAQAPAYQDPAAKSKLVAGLLGILLGGLGIHRFYLGYTNIGIAQLATDIIGWVLLPFTCGVSLVFILGAHVWGLVDGIMILTGSISHDAQGKPLRD